jgi:soluble lytic murein transglycosylase-like protein
MMETGGLEVLKRIAGGDGRAVAWRLGAMGLLVAGALVTGAALSAEGTANAAESGPVRRAESSLGLELPELLERAAEARAALAGVELFYEREILPIERVLLRYRNEPELVQRIALALTREAAAVGLEPRLLLAVLLVENPWLDPAARSPVGAQGLMQVMPFHAGNWRGCDGSLDEVEPNICYGARIFSYYYGRENGNVERALLRYNGCVRGTNTPDCHLYPWHVYARAGRASILAWLEPSPSRAAAP